MNFMKKPLLPFPVESIFPVERFKQIFNKLILVSGKLKLLWRKSFGGFIGVSVHTSWARQNSTRNRKGNFTSINNSNDFFSLNEKPLPFTHTLIASRIHRTKNLQNLLKHLKGGCVLNPHTLRRRRKAKRLREKRQNLTYDKYLIKNVCSFEWGWIFALRKIFFSQIFMIHFAIRNLWS